MGKLTTNLLLATSFIAVGLTIGHAAPPAAPTPPIGKIDLSASRYQLGQLDSQVRDTWSKATMSRRKIDPFGLAQDPNAEPPKPKSAPATKKSHYIAPTPFADVIAAVRVNGVMPAKGRFLIRDRSFRKGESFPIKYNEKTVQVLILEVTEEAITFKNLGSGETASLALNQLPPGMERGNRTTGPPGLQRDDSTSPIEVSVPTTQTPPTAAAEPR